MAASIDDIAKSVRRVRFSEMGFGDGDKKLVWHQGIEGFDLVTHVNLDGKALEQELTYRETVILWRPHQPILTGHPHKDSAADSSTASLIEFDDMPLYPLMDQAADVLERVPGEDLYLRLLATNLRAQVSGGDDVTGVVTNIADVDAMTTLNDQPVPKLLPRLFRRLFGTP